MNTVWTIVTLIATGLIIWLWMRTKLCEMKAKADFYEKLSYLWKEVSKDRGGYASPCVYEGLAYINSVRSKVRRGYVKEGVYRLLDSSYHYYLYMLNREVNRRLARSNESRKDESLHLLFEQNRNWLAFDEEACDWYDADTFESPKTGKSPNRARKILLDQMDACGKRLAEQKAAEEERFRKLLAL